VPSRVVCESGHYGGRRRDAAIELSQNGSLLTCSRCGKPRHYFVSQFYPRYEETHEYELEKVVRIYSPEDAEAEGYDPMIFLLRHQKSGDKVLWPFYWVKDKRGKWGGGQFPPMLHVEEFKMAIKKLEGSEK
jgi:hypothetical protein